ASWLRCSLALLLAVAVGALSARQDGKKPRSEEEDDPPAKKPMDKKEKTEEEEPVRPDKSRVLDIEDDPKEKAPPPRPAGDLASLARSERDLEAKALFQKLATPADTITHMPDRVKGRVIDLRARPISVFIADRKGHKEALTVHPVDRPGEEKTLKKGTIQGVRYYEQTAADAIERFMKDDRGARHARLVAAEQALSAVLRFHQSAAQRDIRVGAEWHPLEARLRSLLIEALLGQMDALVESKAWKAAFDLAPRLAEAAPRFREEDHRLAAAKVAGFLQKALKDSSFSRPEENRQRLKQIEELFPGTGAGQAIADNLRGEAASLLAQAEDAEKGGKKAVAIDLLRRAADLWPELPGLRAAQTRIDRTYQVLRVGGRGVPQKLSPARASTEPELRALDLMFEGLVHLVPDDEGRLYYRPQLAAGRPEVLALGRRFSLPPDAKWADGRPLRGPSVKHAYKRLEDSPSGRMKAWTSLLGKPEMEGVSSKVSLRLIDGFLDPQAPMSFKLLPDGADEPSFDARPFGSGPFLFAGEGTDAAGAFASFTANPHYGAREGKRGLPRLSEVRFYSPADPVKALTTKQIDLALDLTGEQAAALSKLGYEVRKPDRANRRIWFLAVNNKELKDADLRMALSRAIPRERLLDLVFRKGLDEKRHASLNGPYPARSWASDPALVAEGKPADPYDADLAKAKLKEALSRSGLKEMKLAVLYPTGDKQAEKAMGELCDLASKALDRKLTLLPEGIDPYRFREKVERGDYQLAYCHYDFPEGAFWLGPLLAAGEKEENFLRYGGPLQAKIESAMKSRDFTVVKKRAHEIHRQFLNTEMPFIPLWQLDPLMAMKRGVIDAPPFEASHPFARIGEWRVVR
ncbi:MAG: hypothetical protein K2W96_11285, partial [Gemmataceae bacterium]|nr:hypothetical protein [Gemmataceae bacterium]